MYRNLRQCVNDLTKTGRMIRIEEPIDPKLEMAAIQRRVFAAGGPALYFANVKGCRFPMVSNLYGTIDRLRYIFRDSIAGLRRVVRLGMDPTELLQHPRLHFKTPWHALYARPKRVRSGPVLNCRTTIDQLPGLVSWPDDGGPYITLPQVYTEDPNNPGFTGSNLGMYRVQLSGGEYTTNAEVGLHYQIQRGIAVHHAAALAKKEPLPVTVFVGGSPAMTLSAVMPLPEGMSELMFAGLLGKSRVPMIRPKDGPPIYAEADFCITGYLDADRCLPEGPFGDHLGYYSLQHEFPVMKVEQVYHRKDAIWPFTVVGRPPQEDTMFGQFIHEITESVVPSKLPGVRSVHAVDAAGVHPLLLAVGSERYVPYEQPRRTRELLTLANSILGFGQMSLAKYLWLAAGEDDPQLNPQNIEKFFMHMLSRVDWRTDLHFQTETTIDTLDYSGSGLNAGSKLVVAVAGEPRRELPTEMRELPLLLPGDRGFRRPEMPIPGVLIVEGPAYRRENETNLQGESLSMRSFVDSFRSHSTIMKYPLVVVVDDSEFTASSLENFLWVTFTRSNPAADIYGIQAFQRQKHWGCEGPVVIDARAKPHHAPALVEDPDVTARVESLAATGGPLHGIY